MSCFWFIFLVCGLSNFSNEQWWMWLSLKLHIFNPPKVQEGGKINEEKQFIDFNDENVIFTYLCEILYHSSLKRMMRYCDLLSWWKGGDRWSENAGVWQPIKIWRRKKTTGRRNFFLSRNQFINCWIMNLLCYFIIFTRKEKYECRQSRGESIEEKKSWKARKELSGKKERKRKNRKESILTSKAKVWWEIIEHIFENFESCFWIFWKGKQVLKTQ